MGYSRSLQQVCCLSTPGARYSRFDPSVFSVYCSSPRWTKPRTKNKESEKNRPSATETGRALASGHQDVRCMQYAQMVTAMFKCNGPLLTALRILILH